MKSIPPCETVSPEPHDMRLLEPKRDHMKCRADGPYWNTEGILNNRVPYDKDLLNGRKPRVNFVDYKVSK